MNPDRVFFVAGLFTGLLGILLLGLVLYKAEHPQNNSAKNTARVIQAVGKYVADPSHENWYHLGAAYAKWLEEA